LRGRRVFNFLARTSSLLLFFSSYAFKRSPPIRDAVRSDLDISIFPNASENRCGTLSLFSWIRLFSQLAQPSLSMVITRRQQRENNSRHLRSGTLLHASFSARKPVQRLCQARKRRLSYSTAVSSHLDENSSEQSQPPAAENKHQGCARALAHSRLDWQETAGLQPPKWAQQSSGALTLAKCTASSDK
jgi:hypothetical protein